MPFSLKELQVKFIFKSPNLSFRTKHRDPPAQSFRRLGSKPSHIPPKSSQQALSRQQNNTYFVQVDRDSDGREYQSHTEEVTQPDLMSIGSGGGYCPFCLTASALPWRVFASLRLAKTAGRQPSRAGQAMRMGNFHNSRHLPALQAPQ